MSEAPTLSIGQCATLACILEATTPKPGNVHRGADFDDLSYPDLVVSGVAIAPAMEAASTRSVGQTVLEAVRATQQLVATNSNLGTILLLAPLAAVPRDVPLRPGVQESLARLTAQDAAQVYEAIRLARPGGLGKVEASDVAGPPPADLRSAMALAAERDLVAKQYANGFAEVFDCAAPWLAEEIAADRGLPEAILRLHLRLMSRFPDSLIARKAGLLIARQSADRAAVVLERAAFGAPAFDDALADLDFWLRSAGRRRNPGTTADFVAAALFVGLREGIVVPPLKLTLSESSA